MIASGSLVDANKNIPKIRETDLSGGPHAPGTADNVLNSRAARSGVPQGRWESEGAILNAAAKYDSSKGGVQVVEIRAGDGTVFHNPAGSFPADTATKSATQNSLEISTGPLKNPADRAILIPKEDGLHLFPIDSTHPQYSTNYIGGK
jgi:hypothetical protein